MAATKTKKKISDFFNQISNPAGGFPVNFPGSNAISTPALMSKAPVGGGGGGSWGESSRTLASMIGGVPPPLYTAPKPKVVMPANPAPAGMSMVPNTAPVPTPVVGGSRGAVPMVAPAASAPVAPTGSEVPKHWLRADGSIKTPDEIAADIATSMKGNQAAGDVGKLAMADLSTKPKTLQEMQSEAMRLNNTRNDIASGETDPYKVASQSGVAFSPAELSAIEKAYGGVYDPAITTVFAKMQAKQDADAAAAKSASEIAADERAQANKLAQMETQFGYDKALKQIPTPGQAGSSSFAGTYVPGENPTVDSWAKRIFDGSAKITDIPASEKGLRNQVVIALESSGNNFLGRPTRTELGIKASEAAVSLINKLISGEGTSAVGKSRIFGGSLAIPGSEKSNFVIDHQNLKDMLSLDGTRYLKGQGAVSDAERALLASAVTKLNLSQSEEDYKATLEEIRDTLNGTKFAGEEAALGAELGGGETYTIGQVISGGDGKQYRIVGLTDPNDPDVEPI